MRKFLIAMGAMAVIAGVAVAPMAVSVAQDANKAAYDKRSKAMKSIGDSMGALGKVAKGETPYSPDAVKAAETVSVLAKDIAGLFPAGSGITESRSKPNIWTAWPDFQAKAKAMMDPADKLVVAAKTGNKDEIGKALGAAGAACKACHDDYRAPPKT